MYNGTIEENSCQNLAYDGQQGNSTIVSAGLVISFVFVQVYDGGILEVLWHCLMLPDELE